MEDTMIKLFIESQIGTKNIIFGALLFLLFAFGVGVPLTLNFLASLCYLLSNINSRR